MSWVVITSADVRLNSKEAKNPTGLIDVHAVGLMRVALDRGMKLDVESDYVPKWLIGLEQS